MLDLAEKAYCQALLAIKNKDYRLADSCFEKAATAFGDNREFALLRETNSLLIRVKNELVAFDEENILLEEALPYGQETKLR